MNLKFFFLTILSRFVAQVFKIRFNILGYSPISEACLVELVFREYRE
jgi:hypothetical protein